MYFSFQKKRRKRGLYKSKLKFEMMKTFSKFMNSDSDSKPVEKDILISDMLRIGGNKKLSKTASLPSASGNKIIVKKPKKSKKKFKPLFSLSSITSAQKKPKYEYTLGVGFSDLKRRTEYLFREEEEAIDREFEELNHVDYSLNREEGKFSTGRAHPKLNRFKGIVANEDTRVIMKSKKYINANFIPGNLFGIPYSYIATQAPLPNTVDLFWDMMWEQDARIIVMFQEIENTPVHSFVYKDFYDPDTKKEEEKKKKEEKQKSKKKKKKKKKKNKGWGFLNIMMSQPDDEDYLDEEDAKSAKSGKNETPFDEVENVSEEEKKKDDSRSEEEENDGFGAMFRQRMIHQYWPDEGEKIKKGEIGKERILIENVDEDESLLDREGIIIRTLRISKEGVDETREVFMYQYTKWPDMSVPSDPVAFLGLVNRVHDKAQILNNEGKKGPIVLHCVAGIGRTGTFATVHIVISQLLKFLSLQKKREKLEKENLSKQFLMFAGDIDTPVDKKNDPFDSHFSADIGMDGEPTPSPDQFKAKKKNISSSMFDLEKTPSPKVKKGQDFSDSMFDVDAAAYSPKSAKSPEKCSSVFDSPFSAPENLFETETEVFEKKKKKKEEEEVSIIEDMGDTFKYNFFDIVKNLKKRRKGMVQRIEQYKFCIRVVLEEAKKLGLEKE